MAVTQEQVDPGDYWAEAWMDAVVAGEPWWLRASMKCKLWWEQVEAFLAWFMVKHGAPAAREFGAAAQGLLKAVDDASAPLADRLEAGAGGRFCLAALAFWFVAPTARYRANETEALALVLWLWARRGAAVDAGLARAALAEARALRRVADLAFDGVAGDKKTRALRLVSHAAKDLNASLLVGAAPGPLPLRGLHAYVGHVAEAGAILAAAESAEAAAAEREALLLDSLAPPRRVALVAALVAATLVVDVVGSYPKLAAVLAAALAIVADALHGPGPARDRAARENGLLVDDLDGYLRAH